MKIAYISAGTGSFYCGTCIRDEALVAELSQLNHDVHLVSLYLPWYAPESGTTTPGPTFLGGMSVYLRHRYRWLRSLPNWTLRALDRPSLLRWIAKRFSGAEPAEIGPMTESLLRGVDGPQVKEIRRLTRWLKSKLDPDVVCLSNALLLSLAGPIREALDVPVLCTLQGEEGFLDALNPDDRDACWRILQAQAARADGFIAVSQDTQTRMSARLKLPRERVRVVHNGINLSVLESQEVAQRQSDRPVIGYMARMCRDKGLDQLVTAYVRLCSHWDERSDGPRPGLLISGTVTPSDQAFVEEMKELLMRESLFEQVAFHPNFPNSAKGRLLRSMDVCAVPGPSTESFGLYLIEALACGVPVVAPNHAAFPEILNQTGGGILFDAQSTEGLAEALRDLLCDKDQRKMLAKMGQAKVQEHYTAQRMAREVSEILSEYTGSQTKPGPSLRPEARPGAC
jgi:glycosyltransferase involved in cell wall biosynthesis